MHFTSKITNADGEVSETQVWLDFAKDCGYINENINKSFSERYEEVGKMLDSMADHPERFLPRDYQVSDDRGNYGEYYE